MEMRWMKSLLWSVISIGCLQVSISEIPVQLWDGTKVNFNTYLSRTYQRCYDLLPEKLYYIEGDLRFQIEKSFNIHSEEPQVNRLKPEVLANAWRKCCLEAKICWKKMSVSINISTFETCPAMWDGIQCWNQQDSGTRIFGSCPDILYLTEERSLCERFSSRICRIGPKMVDNTDYSTCKPLEFQRAHSYQPPSWSDKINNNTNKVCCRTERRVGLSWNSYRLDTCARCYNYLPSGLLTSDKFVYDQDTALLRDPLTNVTYWAEWLNSSHPIYKTFISHSSSVKWKSCCLEASNCCSKHQLEHHNSSQTVNNNSTDSECPPTWDGWQCYPQTPAGRVAMAPCAEHIYFKTERPSCPKFAEKMCGVDGRWFIDERRGKEWTSYKPCGRLDDLRRQLIFHMIMHAISVAGLIPALGIFFVYKQLQVYRISMHKHFFSSLLLNGLCSIIFKCIVMLDELDRTTGDTVLDYNNPWCKFLFILTKYFRLTNYMWMFSEGFYLHKLIAAAFAEQKNLIVFYLIGWGFPLLPVTIYASLRKTFFDEQCWIIPAHSIEWFVNGPSLLSLVINLFFLCNIIRVLVTKLRATHSSEPSQYRKAVRATVVLIPLFGLHFLFILYRPQSGSCDFLTGYVYFSHTLDGLQGFFVALTFCYCNGEVLYLLRRTYQREQMRSTIGRQTSTANAGGQLSMSTQMSMAEYTITKD